MEATPETLVKQQRRSVYGFNKRYWLFFLIGALVRLSTFYYFHIVKDDYFATDIDYWVYLDGARAITRGGSPYERHTYRYSPLLAQIMAPAVHWQPFGKLLLVTVDLAAALYIKWFLDLDRNLSNRRKADLSALWLLNPLTAHISLRGSCESLTLLMLGKTLYHLKRFNQSKATYQFVAAALTYGLLVHFRVYPIIFALPFYLYLNHRRPFFHYRGICFGLISGALFLALFAYYFSYYGMEFARECFFYHFGRKDHRHSYSYFFVAQNYHYDKEDKLLGMLAKLPKFLLVGLAGSKYYKNLGIAALLQTLIFIMFKEMIIGRNFNVFNANT